MGVARTKIKRDLQSLRIHHNELVHNLSMFECPMSGLYNELAAKALREELMRTKRRIGVAETKLERHLK